MRIYASQWSGWYEIDDVEQWKGRKRLCAVTREVMKGNIRDNEEEINIVDTGLTTASGRRIAFVLVRSDKDDIKLWETTLLDKDSPEAQELRHAF